MFGCLDFRANELQKVEIDREEVERSSDTLGLLARNASDLGSEWFSGTNGENVESRAICSGESSPDAAFLSCDPRPFHRPQARNRYSTRSVV